MSAIDYGKRKTSIFEDTLFLNSIYLLFAGLGAGLILFVLLYLFIPYYLAPHVSQDSEILGIQLIFNVGALACIFITGLAVGTTMARLVSIPIMNMIENAMGQARDQLNDFTLHAKWPGRRFLDLLRPNRLQELRREFLSLSLDINLRVPDSPPTRLIDRMSTVLCCLEVEAKNNGYHDLYDTAENARNLLRRFSHLERIRRIYLVLIYSTVTIGLILAGAYLFDLFYIDIKEINILKDADFIDAEVYYTSLVIILLLSVPISVYIVGQTLYILTWNISKRTSTELDDILFLVFCWFMAGLVGIYSLYKALAYSEKTPTCIKAGFNTLKELLIPGMGLDEKSDHAAKELLISDKLSDEGLAVSVKEIIDQSKSSANETVHFLEGFTDLDLFIIRAAAITLITSIAILFVLKLCVILRDWAAKTEDKTDDMVVELVRIFGTLIIGALGVGWIFLFFISEGGFDKIPEAGALMPYVILVAVGGAILGIASREMLENFFAGISLQIDEPFVSGERVLLESGDICEVRQIGMRSTQFYNLTDNSELYVPNAQLARQSLKNLSRPDREYRRSIKIPISCQHDESEKLVIAEGLLLLSAFIVDGVDLPKISEDEIKERLHLKNRHGILDEFERIIKHYEKVTSALIKHHDEWKKVDKLIVDICHDISKMSEELSIAKGRIWDQYQGKPQKKIDLKDSLSYSESKRIKELNSWAESAHLISYKYHELEMVFFKIVSSYPAMAPDLENIINEIHRAPSIRSRHISTEGMNGAWELELFIYADLSERSDEVLHYINILVLNLLREVNIS
jgi:hypothetical protein